jgi:hypothetical protein
MQRTRTYLLFSPKFVLKSLYPELSCGSHYSKVEGSRDWPIFCRRLLSTICKKSYVSKYLQLYFTNEKSLKLEIGAPFSNGVTNVSSNNKFNTAAVCFDKR